MVAGKPRRHRRLRMTYTARSGFAFTNVDNIANTIVRIMEDGPQPMVERKPTKRVRNSAELFNDTHQTDYETRGQQTTDWVKTVNQHNRAFPVMYDELHKRKSLSKNSVGKIQNATQCVSSKPQNKRKRHHGGISKRKHSKTHYYYSMLNKSCQYELPKEKLSKIISKQVPECSKKLSKTSQARSLKKEDTDQTKGLGSKADIDNNNSKPSVSTYESFVSLNNEPMVGPKNFYS